jgi:hypothetical protein
MASPNEVTFGDLGRRYQCGSIRPQGLQPFGSPVGGGVAPSGAGRLPGLQVPILKRLGALPDQAAQEIRDLFSEGEHRVHEPPRGLQGGEESPEGRVAAGKPPPQTADQGEARLRRPPEETGPGRALDREPDGPGPEGREEHCPPVAPDQLPAVPGKLVGGLEGPREKSRVSPAQKGMGGQGRDPGGPVQESQIEPHLHPHMGGEVVLGVHPSLPVAEDPLPYRPPHLRVKDHVAQDVACPPPGEGLFTGGAGPAEEVPGELSRIHVVGQLRDEAVHPRDEPHVRSHGPVEEGQAEGRVRCGEGSRSRVRLPAGQDPVRQVEVNGGAGHGRRLEEKPSGLFPGLG